MGTDAHRGTQLALSSPYAAIAADRDCNFLAHFGLTLEESLQGVLPVATSGAVLRRLGGRFDGCAMILSNATEYSSNGDLASGLLAPFAPLDAAALSAELESWPTTECPNRYGRVIHLRTTGLSPDADYSRHYGLGATLAVGADGASRTFCALAWVIGSPGTKGSLRVQCFDETPENDARTTFTCTGDWQPVHVVKSFSASAAATTAQVRVSFDSQGVGQDMWATDLSLKELAYPTCFGPIAGGGFAYPIDALIPDRSAWTMSGWFKPLKTAAQGGRAVAFSFGRDTQPACEDFLRLGWGPGSDAIAFSSYRKTALGASKAEGSTQPVYPRDGSHYHLALAFDWPNRKYLLYVDGELALTVDCGTFPSAPDYTGSTAARFNQQGFLGYFDRSFSNLAVSEFRMDRRVVSADEIASWAQSEAPFYPRGLHRILMDEGSDGPMPLEPLPGEPPPDEPPDNAPPDDPLLFPGIDVTNYDFWYPELNKYGFNVTVSNTAAGSFLLDDVIRIYDVDSEELLGEMVAGGGYPIGFTVYLSPGSQAIRVKGTVTRGALTKETAITAVPAYNKVVPLAPDALVQPPVITNGAGNVDSATITWTHSGAYIDGFTVRWVDQGVESSAQVGPGARSYTATGLSLNTLIAFTVDAYNLEGDHALSGTYSVATRDPSVPYLVLVGEPYWGPAYAPFVPYYPAGVWHYPVEAHGVLAEGQVLRLKDEWAAEDDYTVTAEDAARGYAIRSVWVPADGFLPYWKVEQWAVDYAYLMKTGPSIRVPAVGNAPPAGS